MSDTTDQFNNKEQDKIDLETLEGLEPVSSLSDLRLRELAELTTVEYVDALKCLFVEGDKDGEMIYLLNGEIELRSATKGQVFTIKAGTPESWIPIANRQPRQLTAITKTPSEIIRIDLDQFDQMLTWDQVATVSDPDDDKILVKGMGDDWRNKLRNNLTLNNLPSANIEKLFERMEPLEVDSGNVIIRQGEAGDYFYLIDSGTARVSRTMREGMAPIELAMLGPGVSFGEEALISDKPRNANVVMTSKGKLYRLSKVDFDELLKAPLQEFIDLGTALGRMEAGAIFLDVRVPSEYSQGHMPNSINIPLNELRQRVAELVRDTTYICCCSTGRRSSAAAFILNQQGIQASTLQKGIKAVPGSTLV